MSVITGFSSLMRFCSVDFDFCLIIASFTATIRNTEIINQHRDMTYISKQFIYQSYIFKLSNSEQLTN